MLIAEQLQAYSEQLKRDWHALGVIDGLIEAEALLRGIGHLEAATLLLEVAEAKMRKIDAEVAQV